MVQARPIPAIFLYKEVQGSQFVYNILDGKQRLESLLLFIGDERSDLRIDGVDRYFFRNPAKDSVNFSIPLDGKAVTFAKLEDQLVAKFREYEIPTIEIELDENTTIDEIVDLFIDINQQGVKVSRFQIVQARTKDKLFRQVFGLIALRQTRRGKSKFFKPKQTTPYVRVMKHLSIINRIPDQNSQVERMWERLTELALFVRSKRHRAPVSILKAFITSKDDELNERLTQQELTSFRRVFAFLDSAYKQYPSIQSSRLATDQPQFYTLVTTLLSSDLFGQFSEDSLAARISKAAKLLSGEILPTPELKKQLSTYKDRATKQTTNPDRRTKRQEILTKLILESEPNDVIVTGAQADG